MKRLHALAVAVICIFCATASAQVLNGSMETGPSTGVRDNWTAWQSSWTNTITFGRASANKYDGSYSQYWARTADNLRLNGGVYQVVTGLTAGTQYRIQAAMKKQCTATGAWMEFGYDLSGGTNGESASVVYSPLQGGGDNVWVLYDRTVVASGTSLTLFGKGGHYTEDGGGFGYFYLDAVSLTAQGGIVVSQEVKTSAGALTTQPSAADNLNGKLATKISGGFHTAVTNPADKEPAFTDGASLGSLTGLLMDYPGAQTPAWSGYWNLSSGAPVSLTELRVFSGNLGADGRIWHHYNVYTTTANPPVAGSTWTLLTGDVYPAALGTANTAGNQAALTKLTRSGGGALISGITGLRVDFFAVSDLAGQSRLIDAKDTAQGGDAYAAAFVSPMMFEVDAFYSAAPTVTPSPTPPGTPTPSLTPSPSPTPSISPTPVALTQPIAVADPLPDAHALPDALCVQRQLRGPVQLRRGE